MIFIINKDCYYEYFIVKGRMCELMRQINSSYISTDVIYIYNIVYTESLIIDTYSYFSDS